MRILVLGANYSPERTAVAPFTTGLCEHLASTGQEIEVITAFPYYPEWRVWDGYRGRFYQRDLINQVPLHRVWHFVPGRPSRLLQRLAFDLSFTVSFFLVGLGTAKCDVIYCVCPPPTLALTAYVLGKIKRAPYVIKLTDLASDAALSTGILKPGPAVRLARAVERFVYCKAEAVICLCQGFVDKLTEHGLAPEKLYLIPDWADTHNIRPLQKEDTFRKTNGVSENQFLALHTGNMGKKQDLMNVIRAAELSRGERGIVWGLVGEGEERTLLETEIRQRHLHNVKLLPLQPTRELPQMYSAADALLLNQKAAVKDSVIPSKLLTYMAAGRAVVAAVNSDSEVARQVRQALCGLLIPAEDPRALLEAVSSLRHDPAQRQRLGVNGRVYAEKNFTKQKVLQQYDEFFARFASKRETALLASDKVVAAH